MRPTVTDGVAWSVDGRSVGLHVTIVSPAKTAEPIKMRSGVWTRVWVQGSMCWKGLHIGATWWMRLNRPCLTTCSKWFPCGRLSWIPVCVEWRHGNLRSYYDLYAVANTTYCVKWSMLVKICRIIRAKLNQLVCIITTLLKMMSQ